jgi:hypothetical protein
LNDFFRKAAAGQPSFFVPLHMRSLICIPILLHLLLWTGLSGAQAQGSYDTIPDTTVSKIKFINPNPDISNEAFIQCERATILFYGDTLCRDIVYLRKNFTDQFLQVCYSSKIYPASGIWGYNMNNKYFRTGETPAKHYVFAERIARGKFSLFYCRNMPTDYGEIELVAGNGTDPDYRNRMIIGDPDSKRYKNDYSYFISPAADSSKMIFVGNKNIKTVAKEYFADCPPAYDDAMRFHNRYRVVQNITLPVGVLSYLVSAFLTGPKVNAFNYESPFLYVGLASIGTYIYFRIKGKTKYLHPNDMIRIVGKYNSY